MLASYYLTFELIKKCKSLGVKKYNFGAIDKLNKPGVYHLKKVLVKMNFSILESGNGVISFMRFIINISIKLLMSDKLRKIIPYINNLKF